jgi:predicted DNA-binding transcriptional regulator AlpA
MEKATYTLAQFMEGHNVSRTHFYRLVKADLAPRVMRVGRRVLISAEAAAEWRKRMEDETANQAKSFWDRTTAEA